MATKLIKKRFILVTIGAQHNSFIRQFFLNPKVYALVASFFYRIAKKPVCIFDEIEDDVRNGFEHNFSRRRRNDQFRPDKCFRIARSHNYDLSRCKLLIVGPRNFTELLLAWFHGFSWKNIIGVDLFSEFPKVKLGKVEYLPFPDRYFDVVVCSGVLNYVAKLESAMESLVRVTREDGLIILQTDITLSDKSKDYDKSGHLDINEKIFLVGDNVKQVTFREDILSLDRDTLHQFAAFKVGRI